MSRTATVDARAKTPENLADHFLVHWEEVVRFIQDRKRGLLSSSGPEAELSHAQLGALTVLAESDMRMGDLAEAVGLSESSATRLVDRLEAGGLVERRAVRPDRRSVVAGLTPAGRRLMKRVRARRREFLEEILQTLEPSDRDELVRLFGRVAEALRDRAPVREAWT